MFTAFEHKLGFLSRHASRPLIEEIASSIDEFARAEAEAPTLLRPVAKLLELDLCYALVRHLQWHRAPLFREVIMEFLAREYGIGRAASSTLTARLMDRLAERSAPRSDWDASREDREFLRYLFISTATAPDEARLVVDLGLGSGVLERIKAAAATALAEPDQTRASFDFLPEVDQIFAEIMGELAEELKVTPWVMDEYRLGFVLSDSAVPLAEDALATRHVFQILLHMGRVKEANFAAVVKWSEKLWADEPAEAIEARVEALLLALREKELVFGDYSTKGPRTGKWRLARLGFEITADAFACKFLRVAAPRLAVLPHLHPDYQLAVIKRLKPLHDVELKGVFVEHARQFAPKALPLVARRLARSQDHAPLAATLVSLLGKGGTPWLKTAVCEALTAFVTVESVGLELRKMAESDPSERVREAARCSLVRLGAATLEPPGQHQTTLRTAT